MNKYTPIIGMEIHVELKTVSKMFCGCKNDPFHATKPNIYTCPVCLGLPGALPFANKKAIEWTIQLGLMFESKINRISKFDRKHYFYPDLPKGYQISQYDIPFCYDGQIKIKDAVIKITRVHLEEDTGKLIHDTVGNKKVSLVDFNRSGVPLVEIVSEPEIRSARQAKEYAKRVYQTVRYLDVSDADMEKGGMRLEANVSLQKQGETELPGYKVELKNINSFRFLERAIEYEIERQAKILDLGNLPVQETRGYNCEKNMTFSQRGKEEAADYSYFPDPDLPPIEIDNHWLDKIKENIPETYDALFSRWQKTYGIKQEAGELLFETVRESKELEKLFNQCIKEKIPVEKMVNAMVHKKIKTIEEYRKTTGVDEISNTELNELVKKAIGQNPEAVKDFKAGKANAVNFLVGQTMKLAKKRIEFKKLHSIIVSVLS